MSKAKIEKVEKELQKLRQEKLNNLAQISKLQDMNETIDGLIEAYENQKKLLVALEVN